MKTSPNSAQTLFKAFLAAAFCIALAISAHAEATNTNPPAMMFTKVFRVDTNSISAMSRSAGLTNNAVVGDVLKAFFKSQEINTTPPTHFWYSFGEQSLTVHNTKESIDRLDKFISATRTVN